MQAKADQISVIMQSTTELYSEFSEYCMNLIRKVYGDRPVVFPIERLILDSKCITWTLRTRNHALQLASLVG